MSILTFSPIYFDNFSKKILVSSAVRGRILSEKNVWSRNLNLLHEICFNILSECGFHVLNQLLATVLDILKYYIILFCQKMYLLLSKCDITSHHITSHHITSHHITSHHITSYRDCLSHPFFWVRVSISIFAPSIYLIIIL